MPPRSTNAHARKALVRTTILLSVVFLFALFSGQVFAQKKFSRTYPTGQNVRLSLANRTGTVTVEGWNRQEISIIANLESPAANIVPSNQSGTITIDVVRDNKDRGEVGNVNFLIRVPYNTMVDIETRIGNLSVTNIRSALVRAHISSEGGITLTNIESTTVAAENVMGDIFFDGTMEEGGNYRFASGRGNINLRVPFNSSFKFVATAPSTKDITFASCSNADMNFLGNGRRVVGKCGIGAATVTVTNQRGSINFLRR